MDIVGVSDGGRLVLPIAPGGGPVFGDVTPVDEPTELSLIGPGEEVPLDDVGAFLQVEEMPARSR